MWITTDRCQFLPWCQRLSGALYKYNSWLFFNRTRLPVSLTDSGFRTKPHSTETAVVYLTDYILEHMERQMITGAVFIGLKKAFDLVYHKCLLFKLEHYGVRGLVPELSYHTNSNSAICKWQYINPSHPFWRPSGFNFGVSAFCFVHQWPTPSV